MLLCIALHTVALSRHQDQERSTCTILGNIVLAEDKQQQQNQFLVFEFQSRNLETIALTIV